MSSKEHPTYEDDIDIGTEVHRLEQLDLIFTANERASIQYDQGRQYFIGRSLWDTRHLVISKVNVYTSFDI